MSDVQIVKIPLAVKDPVEGNVEKIPKFKRMPILYLELIENKRKVDQALINKPYVPNGSVMKSGGATPPLSLEEREENPEKKDIATDDGGNMKDGENDDDDTPILAPTLGEIDAAKPNGEKLLTKESRYPQEESEEVVKKRNEVYFHYQVLKRMHPNAPIPEFTMYSDPAVMAQKYEMIAKKLSLDSSVTNWKRYLIIFVMGLEVVLGKIGSIDVEGFAQQQLISMPQYESLLVELAEKSYTPTGTSRWPVEVRLLMMMVVNMAMFIVCKMISKKTGMNMLGTVNGLMGSGGGERILRPPTFDAEQRTSV